MNCFQILTLLTINVHKLEFSLLKKMLFFLHLHLNNLKKNKWEHQKYFTS